MPSRSTKKPTDWYFPDGPGKLRGHRGEFRWRTGSGWGSWARMPSGMGSQHPSPGTAGAKRLSGHGGHRHDLRVGAGGGRGVGHTEVVRRRPRPAARPGRPTGPSREGRSWTTRVTRPVGHAVGGRTARGGAAVPAPSRDTAAAGGADTGTDRPGAVGVPAVLAHHASPRLATPEVRSTRHAALFDAAEGVNHLAVVGGHSLGMSQYAVGGSPRSRRPWRPGSTGSPWRRPASRSR